MDCGYVIKFDEGYYETKSRKLFDSIYSATIFKSKTKAISRTKFAIEKHNKFMLSGTEWHNPCVIGVKIEILENVKIQVE